MRSPEEIVNIMMEKDAFSKWLGISILEIEKGRVKLKQEIKPEMLNGFSIAHGGILYSLADSALAFAANSHGQKCVSIETSISHLKKVMPRDIIFASAKERNRSKSLGVYEVDLTNQNKELVGLFKGTVYVMKDIW